MNLGINAAHAMTARGGTLTVRLRERSVEPGLAAEIPELKPGRHVWVEVADTGCGMAPAVVARIFEPFFTTKKTGEGTGLGLAVVRSVVRTHEGAIVLRTEPGVGTTFELYFPVAENVAPPAATAQADYPRGQGQRILLVDDETMVTRSMQLVLERLGYVVTVFNRPEPALVRFESGPKDFDLVITDFQMPGMTGIELATRLLTCRPGVAIYIASGFAGNLTVERVRELGMAGLMRKPIEMQELAEVLARVFR
jgi:CheY-like chemotaxis protein